MDKSYYHESSISGTLLQVDINHTTSYEKPLALNTMEVYSSELVPGVESSLAHIKEFFQITMSQGVDSLSQFLIKEFERIVASFDNRDNLNNKPANEEKATYCAHPDVRVSRDIFSGNQYTDAFDCEGFLGE
ncbi:unnamed protein product, partial [Cuscuta epithymum]